MKRKPLSEEHRRKLSEAAKRRTPEQESRRIAALREAKKKEDPSYRHTPEYRERQRQSTQNNWDTGVYEGRAVKTAATRAAWTEEQHAEVCARMSEAKRKEWAEKGPDRNSVPGHLRSRVSKEELSLAPYLEKLGYKHNNAEHYGTDERDQMTFIGRKVPDFVNFKERKVFEYFGSFWHPRPEEEQELIDYYRSKGWKCEVLWDYDREQWLLQQEAMV
jgi:hypothetical protein